MTPTRPVPERMTPTLRVAKRMTPTRPSPGAKDAHVPRVRGETPTCQFVRLWQGVASVPLGREALDGGLRTMWIGLGLHLCVAFWWSAVFLYGAMRLEIVRRVLGSRFGIWKVAAVYGPFVWLVMTLVVIPIFTKRTPTFAPRWWVQLVGHVPFVALPITWTARKGV